MTRAATGKLVLGSLAAVAVLLASGCSGGTAAQPPASEPAASSSAAPSAATPGSLPTGLATPDPNLPANWPVAIPGYPDGRLLSAVVSEDGLNVNGTWATDASAEDAWAAMDGRLRALGYLTSAEAGAADQLASDATQRSDVYVRDGYEVNLVVIPGDQVTVMVNGSAL